MTDLREDGALVDVEHDPVHEYEKRAESFIDEFDRFVTTQFGERCSTFDADCVCCKLWKIRDETQKISIWWERK